MDRARLLMFAALLMAFAGFRCSASRCRQATTVSTAPPVELGAGSLRAAADVLADRQHDADPAADTDVVAGCALLLLSVFAPAFAMDTHAHGETPAEPAADANRSGTRLLAAAVAATDDGARRGCGAPTAPPAHGAAGRAAIAAQRVVAGPELQPFGRCPHRAALDHAPRRQRAGPARPARVAHRAARAGCHCSLYSVSSKVVASRSDAPRMGRHLVLDDAPHAGRVPHHVLGDQRPAGTAGLAAQHELVGAKAPGAHGDLFFALPRRLERHRHGIDRLPLHADRVGCAGRGVGGLQVGRELRRRGAPVGQRIEPRLQRHQRGAHLGVGGGGPGL